MYCILATMDHREGKLGNGGVKAWIESPGGCPGKKKRLYIFSQVKEYFCNKKGRGAVLPWIVSLRVNIIEAFVV